MNIEVIYLGIYLKLLLGLIVSMEIFDDLMNYNDFIVVDYICLFFN